MIDYGQRARNIRLHVLKMTSRAKTSHVGSSFSAAELLAVLYGGFLRFDPADPKSPRRDRFVMSKGHAAAGVYAALVEAGCLPENRLEEFCRDGSVMAGHVTHSIPGIELSTGSLGHGLGVASGMALAAKLDGADYRVAAMLSDGECDEGSVWEAALFASHHRLDNLLAVIDYNKIQSLGYVKDVMDLSPFKEKWESFGWSVAEIDGHDVKSIEQTLHEVPFETGRPSCIIAHTVKGKGVSFMEDRLLWHYRTASGKELDDAYEELIKQ